MTEIDAATGMPVVPEGHFWRVHEQINYDGDHVAYVRLMKKSTRVRKDRVFVSIVVPDPVWYNKKRTKPGRVEETTESIEEYDYPVRGLEVQRNGDELPFFAVTAGDILATAIEILTTEQRSKTVAALMGDYPPKTLDTDD